MSLILSRLGEIEELPALPEVIMKVQSLVSSEEGNATMLAKIIEEDPSLASKILKVANSSFYSAVNKRISSVQLAVARLGFEEVKNITMTMSLIRHFSNRKSILGYKKFWSHSIAAAYLTQAIAGMINTEFDDTEKQYLFLSGLFHDIGILVFDQFFPEVYEQITNHSLKNGKSFLSSEAEVVGKETHPVVGGALLELWKLEGAVVTSVRYHHNPGKSPEKYMKFAKVASLTEYVLYKGHVSSFEGSEAGIDDRSWSDMGLSSEGFRQLFSLVNTEMERINTILIHGNAEYGSTLHNI